MSGREVKRLGRNEVSDMARRYLRWGMGFSLYALDHEQEENQLWRHMYLFGMRLLRAERRRLRSR